MKVVIAVLVLVLIGETVAYTYGYKKLYNQIVSNDLDRVEHEGKLYQAVRDLSYQIDVLTQTKEK